MTLSNFVVDRVTVNQVQSLRQIGFHFYFARTHAFAFCPTKRGQKVGGSVSICDVNRSGAHGQAREFIGRGSHLADAVQHHFGSQASQFRVREIAMIFFIGRIRLCGQLIRS